MIGSEKWIVACGVEDIEVGEVVSIEHEGRALAVYRVSEDIFYSTDDICSHGYAHLSQGFFEDCTIECPLHGGQFDIRTGKGLCEPITTDIQTYQVRIRNAHVEIALGALLPDHQFTG